MKPCGAQRADLCLPSRRSLRRCFLGVQLWPAIHVPVVLKKQHQISLLGQSWRSKQVSGGSLQVLKRKVVHHAATWHPMQVWALVCGVQVYPLPLRELGFTRL